MTEYTLHITNHLYASLSEEQAQCIQTVCRSAQYKLDPNYDCQHFYEDNKHLVLMSETCLLKIFDTDAFIPGDNHILFLTHNKHYGFEKHNDKIKNIRFVLGNPYVHLLSILLLRILTFFKKTGSPSICNDFQNPQANSLSHELKFSGERAHIQQLVSNFFSGQIEKKRAQMAAGSLNYAKILSDVLDEFLMNAIWDANPERAHVERRTSVQLLDSEKVEVLSICDGCNFVLSVKDPFGSFQTQKVEKYVRFLLNRHEPKLLSENRHAGAGLGLYMTLQKIGVLIFEVEKGKMTRATVIARGDQTLRDLQKRPRSVLFFFKD